jgi:hypothetical protein
MVPRTNPMTATPDDLVRVLNLRLDKSLRWQLHEGEMISSEEAAS